MVTVSQAYHVADDGRGICWAGKRGDDQPVGADHDRGKRCTGGGTPDRTDLYTLLQLRGGDTLWGCTKGRHGGVIPPQASLPLRWWDYFKPMQFA